MSISALLTVPCFAQQQAKHSPVGNFFKILGGQPRNAKKVGLEFASVSGVEIYYPGSWAAQENLPDGWVLRLTRPDTDNRTDIHIEDSEAYSFDQVLVYNTETLQKEEQLKSATPGVKRQIGDYKNVPGLEATFVYGPDSSSMRRVVYFGYPPRVHALILDCRRNEYDRLKDDFDHILSTISIHDGVH
jgi:hypothetical protein